MLRKKRIIEYEFHRLLKSSVFYFFAKCRVYRCSWFFDMNSVVPKTKNENQLALNNIQYSQRYLVFWSSGPQNLSRKSVIFNAYNRTYLARGCFFLLPFWICVSRINLESGMYVTYITYVDGLCTNSCARAYIWAFRIRRIYGYINFFL